MPHCYTHDIDYPARHECPECRADEAAESRRRGIEQQEETREDRWREEERQRDRHEEIVRLREREIYKRQNPGDYKCPECFYITLKRGAPRCPFCRAAVGHGYWYSIYENERLQAEEKARQEKLAAEEWAKGAPERQRQAKAAAEEAERKQMEAAEAARVAALAAARAAAEMRQAAIGKGVGYLVLGAIVGAIVGFVAAIIIAIPVWAVAGLLMNDSRAGEALANNVVIVVAVLGAVIGAYMGWSLGTMNTVLDTKRR